MVDTQHNAARRLFLRQAGALSGLGAAAPLALGLAALGGSAARAAGDYKALVCLFMSGGNDSFNTLLRTDEPAWSAYTATRQQADASIALLAPGTPRSGSDLTSPAGLGGVLALSPATDPGATLALHPVLTHTQRLFNTERRLAWVSNIGPLMRPTTKAQYDLSSHPKPAKLFSHNDQQATWQALAPEGAARGWGGRLADRLVAGNSHSVFTAISGSGNAVWLSGQTVQQYQIGSSGALQMGGPDSTDRIFGSAEVTAAMRRIVGNSRSGHWLEAEHARVSQRSIEAEALLRTTLRNPSDTPFGTPPGSSSYNPATDPLLAYTAPANGRASYNTLAQKLQTVARLIDARSTGDLAMSRQVFFIQVDGSFDTHSGQNASHADLLARLDHGLAYFDTVLGSLGLRDKVTTFTLSDFGRTFTSNGDGTDHGWGAHHLVMGGAVRGGRVFGQLPTLGVKNSHNNQFDSSPDQLNNGVLLPTTAVEQLGATLGRWFGVSSSELTDIFPNLSQFSPADLGVMG